MPSESTADRLIRRTALAPGRSRYDGGDAHRGDLGRPAPSQNIRTAVGSVEDPWPSQDRKPGAPPPRVKATLNTATDVLETEFAHDRISEQAYVVGRVLQAAFERGAGTRGRPSMVGADRVDQATDHEQIVITGLDKAREMQDLLRKLVAAVGPVGARFLQKVLGNGHSFAQITRDLGRGDSRTAVAFTAEKFRDLLQAVVDHWQEQQTARGHDPATKPLPIRGERCGAPVPGEAYDIAGVRTTPARAFSVSTDPEGRRWQSREKRRRLEAAARGIVK